MSFEDHVHRVTHLNDLLVQKAETFVVVKYSVHVFNPIGINRPIKDDPSPLYIWFGITAVTEDTSKYSISELLGDCIICAV